jgi:predicted NBD/HSP70 family sugar kinase
LTKPQTIGTQGNKGRGRGFSADELRRHNLATVLERLHLLGPASRSQLTAMTGLNRSTIADLIGVLSELGYAEEGPGVAVSGPGRPSTLVKPRPSGAVVLAAELSVDSIAVATVGLGGHVYNQLRVARPRQRFSPQETVDDLTNLAGPLLGSLPAEHTLVGVGVGVAGITRRSDGFVHLAPNLGWHDVPIAELLARRLGVSVPIRVANEADLGALAEHRRGAHPRTGNLIYISSEVGIGAGIIADGKPLLGSAGYGGEAGHTVINPSGRSCRCGGTGCWETEAGEAALVRHVGATARGTGLSVVNAVASRAETGDEVALRAIAEVGRWLGLGIGNLVNIFNPELVVLGGLYDRLYPFLEDSVVRAARRAALDAPGEMVTIERSGLGVDAALIGAAELVHTEVITDPVATRERYASQASV